VIVGGKKKKRKNREKPGEHALFLFPQTSSTSTTFRFHSNRPSKAGTAALTSSILCELGDCF